MATLSAAVQKLETEEVKTCQKEDCETPFVEHKALMHNSFVPASLGETPCTEATLVTPADQQTDAPR